MKRAIILIVAGLLALTTMGASSCGTTTDNGGKDTGVDNAGSGGSKPHKAKKPAKPRHFSGNGSTNLGTLKVPTDSVMSWTYTPSDPQLKLFAVQDENFQIAISSDAPTGKSAVAAGTYRNVSVNAEGDWTITLKAR